VCGDYSTASQFRSLASHIPSSRNRRIERLGFATGRALDVAASTSDRDHCPAGIPAVMRHRLLIL
jgi:hypothetical protein